MYRILLFKVAKPFEYLSYPYLIDASSWFDVTMFPDLEAG